MDSAYKCTQQATKTGICSSFSSSSNVRAAELSRTVQHFIAEGRQREGSMHYQGTCRPSHTHSLPLCVSLVAASRTLIIPATLSSRVVVAFSIPNDSAPKLPMSVWTHLGAVSDNSYQNSSAGFANLPWVNGESGELGLLEVDGFSQPVQDDF